MNALFALTVANIKSYVRDRAALFWTLAFPLIFIFMFGFIFQGGGEERADPRLGRRGRLARVASELRTAFTAQERPSSSRRPRPRRLRRCARARSTP